MFIWLDHLIPVLKKIHNGHLQGGELGQLLSSRNQRLQSERGLQFKAEKTQELSGRIPGTSLCSKAEESSVWCPWAAAREEMSYLGKTSFLWGGGGMLLGWCNVCAHSRQVFTVHLTDPEASLQWRHTNLLTRILPLLILERFFSLIKLTPGAKYSRKTDVSSLWGSRTWATKPSWKWVSCFSCPIWCR